MFSFSNDRWALGVITFLMLVAVVFGVADAVLERVSGELATMPTDESRLLFVGAGALGFLLGAWRPSSDEAQ